MEGPTSPDVLANLVEVAKSNVPNLGSSVVNFFMITPQGISILTNNSRDVARLLETRLICLSADKAAAQITRVIA
jgi:hypothetical protein